MVKVRFSEFWDIFYHWLKTSTGWQRTEGFRNFNIFKIFLKVKKNDRFNF